jgi:hypothetical protein
MTDLLDDDDLCGWYSDEIRSLANNEEPSMPDELPAKQAPVVHPSFPTITEEEIEDLEGASFYNAAQLIFAESVS